jgi:hypothetical protein
VIELQFNKDLMWESDWNGYEIGYPDIQVVGLYNLRHTDVYFYIDMDNYTILEAWEMREDD